MLKKNIYMIQPTFMSTSSVYFPYAIGSLSSYAWSFKDIADEYELKGIFFLRDKISDIINSLENPFLIGFSNYIWNFEYNKELASEIKKTFPECIIVFGGPQIPEDSSLLHECPFIDFLIHFEGEVPFRDLLRAFLNKIDLKKVNNLSFRNKEGSVFSTPISTWDVADFPSPFQSGFFDRLCEENPDIDFVPLIETNRGCPYHCSYCSWGKIKSKVRFFPIERVYSDIEWASRHKTDFLGIADANFGMFPRDKEIADKIIECHKKYGYPKKFQVSYSSGNKERVFEISKRLNDNGMDKGVTLSFQSMSETVQKNIGRTNVNAADYKILLKKYSEAKIPTYTDLILGLPGETPESFKNGIDELLENGQHTSLFVHLCEWLPLAEMGKREYMDKFQISYTKIPLNQPHRSISSEDNIQEYSRIITSTYSMSNDDWKEMVMFTTCVLCFHHLGLLQYISLYLHYEKGIRYSDFYSELLRFLTETNKSTVFETIKEKVSEIIENSGEAVIFDELFGNIAWPFEEYAFLCIVTQKELFYREIKTFLERYIEDSDLLNELISYQKFVIKSVNTEHNTFSGTHDWHEYFRSILVDSSHKPVIARNVNYTLTDDNTTHSWEEYAKKVLWYGRRGGKNIYTSEIKEVTAEMI